MDNHLSCKSLCFCICFLASKPEYEWYEIYPKVAPGQLVCVTWLIIYSLTSPLWACAYPSYHLCLAVLVIVGIYLVEWLFSNEDVSLFLFLFVSADVQVASSCLPLVFLSVQVLSFVLCLSIFPVFPVPPQCQGNPRSSFSFVFLLYFDNLCCVSFPWLVMSIVFSCASHLLFLISLSCDWIYRLCLPLFNLL